jgi:hypothetical protein
VPSASEIRDQVASEKTRRSRLAVPALAGGVLYLMSGITITSTLNGAPTVGLFQGLTPALRGEANPAESPRASEVRFISHHSFALIAGSVLAAIAIGALTLVLLLLLDAARFRRPQTWSGARPLVLCGGIVLVVVSIGHQVVSAIETHNFVAGHDFSNHAVDDALTKGTANVLVDYLDLVAGLALAAGMVVVLLNTMRVGLLTRWMGVVGIFTAVLIFLPIGGATLEVVPAFWLVATGILFAGHWPNGDPPAWGAGEARPWPTQAEVRAARQAGKGEPATAAAADVATAAADVAPAPAQPPRDGSSRRRRRKRGARR